MSYLLLAFAEVLLAVDMQQTLSISKNPKKYWEKNPILGDHPKVKDVYLYFASCMILLAVVSYLLPVLSAPLSIIVIILELIVIFKNKALFGAWW